MPKTITREVYDEAKVKKLKRVEVEVLTINMFRIAV